MPAERVSACFSAWTTLVLFIFQGLWSYIENKEQEQFKE